MLRSLGYSAQETDWWMRAIAEVTGANDIVRELYSAFQVSQIKLPLSLNTVNTVSLQSITMSNIDINMVMTNGRHLFPKQNNISLFR